MINKFIFLAPLLVFSLGSSLALTPKEKLEIIDAAASWFNKQAPDEKVAAFQAIILKCKEQEEKIKKLEATVL